jgi:hypothetical protein
LVLTALTLPFSSHLNQKSEITLANISKVPLPPASRKETEKGVKEERKEGEKGAGRNPKQRRN